MEQNRDEEIRAAVVCSLPLSPARDITVNASGGRVTLTGSVGSHTMKILAEEAAKSVGGVRLVANELHVQSMAFGIGTDVP